MQSILNIDDVEAGYSGKYILVNFNHFNRKKSLEELSDGTILLIALITKVLSSEKSIFFIEEPENSIHPKALRDLILFLQSFGEEKQFLISTHSSNLLNMVQPEQVFVAHLDEKNRYE